MKKIKLLILSIFTVVSTVYSQNAQPEYFRNAWEFGKLKGKVKSYTESHFDVDGMLLSRMTNNFDNTGNLIEEYFYNKNDILQSRNIYIYDTSDKIIERKKFNADGKLLHRKIGKFDNKGHIVEFRNSNSNAANILEIKFTCVNTYNDSDKIIEQTRYNSDGRKRRHSTYKYDMDNNELESCEYDAEGVCLSKNIYLYKDKSIEFAYYYYNGKLSSTFKYDVQGNLIELIVFNEDNTIKFTDSYKYNDKGSLVETHQYGPDGSLASKNIYKYDYLGNKIECSQFVSECRKKYDVWQYEYYD